MATNPASPTSSSRAFYLDTTLVCRRRAVAALLLSSIEILREVSSKESSGRLGVFVLLLQLGYVCMWRLIRGVIDESVSSLSPRSMCVAGMRVSAHLRDEGGTSFSTRWKEERHVLSPDIDATRPSNGPDDGLHSSATTNPNFTAVASPSSSLERCVLSPDVDTTAAQNGPDDEPHPSAASDLHSTSIVSPFAMQFFPCFVPSRAPPSSSSQSFKSGLSSYLTPSSTLHLNGLHHLILQDISFANRPLLNPAVNTDEDEDEEPISFAEPSPSDDELDDMSCTGHSSDFMYRSDRSFASTSSPSPSPYKKTSWSSQQGPTLVQFPVSVQFPTSIHASDHTDIGEYPTTPPRRPRPSLRKVLSATRRSFARLSHRDSSEDLDDAREPERRHSIAGHMVLGPQSPANEGVGDACTDDDAKRSRKWSLRRLGSHRSVSGLAGLKALGHRMRKASEASSGRSDASAEHDEGEGVQDANHDRRPHKLHKKRTLSHS